MTIRALRAHPLGMAGMAAVTVVGAALATATVTGLRINGTPSMPRGLWRVTSTEVSLRRGAIVTICPPDTPPFREAATRGYMPAGSCPGRYEPLVKPIGAASGDVVAVSESGVTVNGQAIRGTAPLAQDSVGRPLRPVRPGTYPVAPGEVWLLSGHNPRSFDSRYFGPVPASNVQGVARPIWVLP